MRNRGKRINKFSKLSFKRPSQRRKINITEAPETIPEVNLEIKETLIPAVEINKVEEQRNEVKNSFSNNFTLSYENSSWFLVSASTIGKSHIKSGTPCQDNHYCESINQDWGIAITCDGAGSAKNSSKGSMYVSHQIGIDYFKNLVIENNWHKNNILPTNEEWNIAAKEGCIRIYEYLNKKAIEEQVNINSFACTMIVIIYSPVGLLVTHVGDGRAGYCNENGEWKPALVPHKGEEANQTIFLTSKKWSISDDVKMSGVNVPESCIIKEKITAFTLMSDGCELHSFECSVFNEEKSKWHDPNLPYPKFFNPLVDNLRIMKEKKISNEESNLNWRKFIERGTNGLKNESDDKTMIIGILI